MGKVFVSRLNIYYIHRFSTANGSVDPSLLHLKLLSSLSCQILFSPNSRKFEMFQKHTEPKETGKAVSRFDKLGLSWAIARFSAGSN